MSTRLDLLYDLQTSNADQPGPFYSILLLTPGTWVGDAPNVIILQCGRHSFSFVVLSYGHFRMSHKPATRPPEGKSLADTSSLLVEGSERTGLYNQSSMFSWGAY